MALRHLFNDGYILVDETNKATAISHWQLFGDHDEEGVPHRNKKTNDKRYYKYRVYLEKIKNPNIKIDWKAPKYDKKTLKIIKEFKDGK